MENIFEDEKIINEEHISLREFVDKASQIILKKDLKGADKSSPFYVSKGTTFRLEIPKESGILRFPRKGNFSSLPKIAREMQEYFKLDVIKDFWYDENLNEKREKYSLETGNTAGVMGYESLSSAAQDFSRFIEFLEEKEKMNKDELDIIKIYAGANGSHPLVKKNKDLTDYSPGIYKFSDLSKEDFEDDIYLQIENSKNKLIHIRYREYGDFERSGNNEIHAILRKLINEDFNLSSEEKSEALEKTRIRTSDKASGAGPGRSGAERQLSYLKRFIDYFEQDINLEESYLKLELSGLDDEESDVNMDTFKEVVKHLENDKNVIVEGVAGSGKSYLLKELRKSEKYGDNGDRIEVVVFHPSTSYEEFFSGIRPNFSKKSDEGDFVTQEGTFIQMCNRAAKDPDNPYLLFIDEINRANTSRVFGDLMLVLEKSKRQDFKDLQAENRDGALFEADFQQMPGEYVRLQTPIFKNGKEYNKLAVPSNLHVLGTMNTTDRSVGTIDLALRRRFHWITQHPYTAEELKEAMKQANETYPDSIASWYEDANKILLEKVGPDARLGHAYFFEKDGDEQAIADALLTQLLEIIFTFNIKEDVLKSIGVPNIDYYRGKYLGFLGEGLGKRPAVKESEKSELAPDNSETVGEATEAETESDSEE